MARIALYNLDGEKKSDLEISDAIFAVETKQDLIHQVYNALRANVRQAWAHVKDRSDVRGGGKKPWKQKGTGRARHGSIRSPIWTGGGVTFGPRNDRNFSQKINKKMNKKAMIMTLSARVAEEKMIALESYDVEGKTKQLSALRQALPGYGKTTLLIIPKQNDALLLAVRNIKKLDVVRAQDVNVVDIMHHQYIIVNKDVCDMLEARLHAK